MRFTKTSLYKRTRMFLICVFCVLIVISGRLVYVQLFSGAKLRLLAAEQWYRDLPLMAKRGDILDINGNVLARSTLTYSVYVRPVAVSNAESVAQSLSTYLELNYQNVLNKVTSRTVSEWLIKMQVEKDVAMRVISQGHDGVFISQTYRRDFPMGATAGQVLGLVSIDNFGQEGIEAFYDKILRGTDGRSAIASDLRGKPLENGAEYYVPSVDGYDVILNIDASIQSILQNTIMRAYVEQGAKSVSALVMDIETGAVLASGAAPFYDLNDQPRDDAATLLSQIKNLPMLNVLEPGSTFKIITLAIAIEEGLTHENEKFNCPGFRVIEGERVKCWRSKGHGMQTLAEGVNQSCNCVFMDLGLRIGVDKYYEYLRKFGIGRKTGVDSNAEPSGLLLDKKWIRNVDLARIAFGQAIAISPIQFQNVVGTIVGDGILRTPRIANAYSDGKTQISLTGKEYGRIITQNTSNRVRDMLYGVVVKGSGKHAGKDGYAIGGKTGTAQKYKDGIIDQGKYISSFIGYLSIQGKAKYSAFIMVDEPSKQGYYGSIVGAPYVGYIFDGIIDYLELPADPNIKGPFIPEWLQLPGQAAPLIELPDVSGMPIHEAIAKLQSLQFFVDVQDDGMTATGTFPAAKSMVKFGEPIVISTQ